MSAYICNPEHFGILAAYAVKHDCVIHPWQVKGEDSILQAQRVAKELAKENIRSVAYRYNGDTDLPGPNLSQENILEAAALYAAHFMKNAQKLHTIQMFKLIMGVEYQSCETKDWHDSLAWRQLDWIMNELVRQMPGYEQSEWSYTRTIPEIEALYKEGAP